MPTRAASPTSLHGPRIFPQAAPGPHNFIKEGLMDASDAIHPSSEGEDELREELRPEPAAARRVPVQDEAKIASIASACDSHDLTALQKLALSTGGFVNDDLRRKAWPLLLGLSSESNDDDFSEWKQLPKHKDEEQVQLDVNRAFIYYPHNLSAVEMDQRKHELSDLIVQVLRTYPFLCYFQGYHDICQVFLLVLGRMHSPAAVSRLSVLRIRDFMLPTLGPTTAQLRLLPDILGKADPELRRHVASIEPFYALAGTLTMYAHNIEAYHDIARLFDILLAREPIFSIYMFAQIVIDRRDEIFEIDEPDLLQVVLARVPPKMDIDALISRSEALYKQYRPDTLRSWRRISVSSAIKTARTTSESSEQTMSDGEGYFAKQAKELQWVELRDRARMAIWFYRKPIRAVGMAMVVGLAAFYLRRNPNIVHSVVALFSR